MERLYDPMFLVQLIQARMPRRLWNQSAMKSSSSPDGRYALAWAPDKKDFNWDDYAEATGFEMRTRSTRSR